MLQFWGRNLDGILQNLFSLKFPTIQYTYVRILRMYIAFCRVLETCEVQLYRQMGSLRDDLALHERAIDLIIEQLKKEQVLYVYSLLWTSPR